MSNQVDGIGSRLRKERERLGLSQYAFGKLGGVATNAQGRYESGDRFPRSDYFVAVARAGVDVLYVLIGTPTPGLADTLTREERHVLINFRSLQQDDQEVVSRLTSSIAGLLVSTSRRNLVSRQVVDLYR